MNAPRHADSPAHALADGEVEEFRLLLKQHADVEMPFDDARVLAGQLMRLLALIREVAVDVAGSEDGIVDKRACQPEEVDQSIGFRSS